MEDHRKRVDSLAERLNVKPIKYSDVGARVGVEVNGYEGNVYSLNELLIAYMLHMVKRNP